MKTIYLKSEPVQSWQIPTYYKIVGTDNDITEITVWNKSSMEITHTDDESFEDYIDYIKNRDLSHPLVEITREEFDKKYVAIIERLNQLSAA